MVITVLIADDHAVVRSGLSMLINAEQDMTVVATAEEGSEAVDKALALKPDVAIFDVNMPPGENGLSAASRLKQSFPEVEILILTMHDDQEYLFQGLNAGASGYILKNAQESDIMEAIRTVSRGEAYLYPQAAKTLIHQYLQLSQTGKMEREQIDKLSSREREVVTFIAKGYSNKEIAEALFISIKTVEAHKSNVMGKLELRTRSELVQYAIRQGYLEL